MLSKVILDHAGIGEVLRSSGMVATITALANEVAATVRARPEVSRHDLAGTVTVLNVITDRAHSVVGIGHVLGQGLQAKYGTLTASAADAGLRVTEWKG